MDESNGREPTDVELMTSEQSARIAALTLAEVSAIDSALLSCCDKHFRKVAFVVGSVMSDKGSRIEGIPDIHYAQRVRRLVEAGLLESAGNLAYMRYSEVRVPRKDAG